MTELSATIKKNNFVLFNNGPLKTSKSKNKLNSAKHDANLFSRLYIGSQNRGGDIYDFFDHENQSYPPSISDSGNLRGGSKSDLIQCIAKLHCNEEINTIPHSTCVVLDGAAIVQMIQPKNCRTFLEYSENMFLPHLKAVFHLSEFVDEFVNLSYFLCFHEVPMRSSES